MSGVFKCAKHNFSCEKPAEMREHFATEVHTRRGASPCNQCNAPNNFVFTGEIGEKEPSLCKKCADMLLAGRED